MFRNGYKAKPEELAQWTVMDNIAEELGEDDLAKIAHLVLEEYQIDLESMSEWRDQYEQGMKLAKQFLPKKTRPWPGASNVSVPLIPKAAIQFNARAYPEIVRDNSVVKTAVVGKKTPEKEAKADRVSKHMSYQLLHESSEWEKSLDKLLIVLPLCGTAFKKLLRNEFKGTNESVLCPPTEIVINNNVSCLDKARRVTHEIALYDNEIIERIRRGLFLDEDYKGDSVDNEPSTEVGKEFLEQHRWLDLDNDGYAEPYIVTVHKASQKVARIVARFEVADIEFSEEQEVIRIEQIQYFVDFHFVPNFEGKFWSYGYIFLLLHGNLSINSILNQLIDAGTLANMPAGIFGKGARLPGGQLRFSPGKWVQSSSSGVDLKNSIFQLPAKEPSIVLFQLLQFLTVEADKLISMSEAMSGQVSGSNTTAAEALSVLEQGMKVLNGIYKRIFLSLRMEYKGLFLLNSRYSEEDQEIYFTMHDEENVVAAQDYDMSSVDVFPVGEAVISSQIERLTKARAALEIGAAVGADMRELGRMYFRALQLPLEDIDRILPAQDPSQPTPEQQQMAKELEAYADQLEVKTKELEQKDRELDIKAYAEETKREEAITKGVLNIAKAEAEEAGTQIDAYMAEQKAIESRVTSKEKSSAGQANKVQP